MLKNKMQIKKEIKNLKTQIKKLWEVRTFQAWNQKEIKKLEKLIKKPNSEKIY